MGNCHPSKTIVNLCFTSGYIRFLRVTISHVTVSCSQFLYDNNCCVDLLNQLKLHVITTLIVNLIHVMV